jgi:hypothetical protein
MPEYHSSELEDMSPMERRRALQEVYGSALRTRRMIEGLRSFTLRAYGTASTPEQTGRLPSLSRYGRKDVQIVFD